MLQTAELERPHKRLMEVLHSVEIDGHILRWVASPIYLETRTPDAPWHAWDDLCRIARVPEAMRLHLQRRLKADWAHETRTVALAPAGIITIAPRYMAHGLLRVLSYRRKILPTADRRRITGQFNNGQSAALFKMTPHLSDLARLEFALAAMK
jgi:hypothetical protein